MSRHRGAKPDRRYGLLDPIHIIPNLSFGADYIITPLKMGAGRVIAAWISSRLVMKTAIALDGTLVRKESITPSNKDGAQSLRGSPFKNGKLPTVLPFFVRLL